MRVVHISTYDVAGGAARAAHRLHLGLQRARTDSRMYVRTQKGDVREDVLTFQPSRDLWSRLRRAGRNQWVRFQARRYETTDFEVFSDPRTPWWGEASAQCPQADVYNLHWTKGFIDPAPFFEQTPGPVVWTLHDMNAFTGGCHYTGGCERFTKQCGACPQLHSTVEEDLSRDIWQYKRSAYEQVDPRQLHIVTPSRWMQQEVERSTLLRRFPVATIPNGVDTDLFKPRDGAGLRRALGISMEARVLLFVAQATSERRKGFRFLLEALKARSKRPHGQGQPGREQHDLYLLSVGGHLSGLQMDDRQLHLGRIENERLLAAVYSAADVFVVPSLQDNLPNTVLEAMACGTPVVGFDAGGIPEMVRPGETGQLARKGDVRALRDALDRLLEDDACRHAMGHTCRKVATSEFALDLQARRYVELYKSLIANVQQSPVTGP